MRKGFTLIELLIVITIIGILAVALVPRISQGPARARDVQRKADLQNLATALELYYADNGEYPNLGSPPDAVCLTESNAIGTALLTYLDEIPLDPSESDVDSCSGSYLYRVLPYYASGSSASSYILASDLETEESRSEGTYCDVSSFSWNSLEEALANLPSYECNDTSTDAVYVYYH